MTYFSAETPRADTYLRYFRSNLFRHPPNLFADPFIGLTRRAPVSALEIARKAKSFDRVIRWRNFREYAASGFVVAVFGYWATRAPGTAETIAVVLVALGALVAAIQIMRLGTPTRPRAELPAEAVLHDWRSELERQARLLEGVRLNYLAPFCPGFILLALAPLIDGTISFIGGLLVAALMLALFGFVLWFVDRLNRRAAAQLRHDCRAALASIRACLPGNRPFER